MNIGIAFNKTIDPATSLLFLDEIQACPELLAKLRWFAEELPELAVVAAGSLLEFTLAEHEFSMPVGRINYFHIEPLSFEEFILAAGKKSLFDYLQGFTWSQEIPQLFHQQLVELFCQYTLVGGMPAVVSS